MQNIFNRQTLSQMKYLLLLSLIAFACSNNPKNKIGFDNSNQPTARIESTTLEGHKYILFYGPTFGTFQHAINCEHGAHNAGFGVGDFHYEYSDTTGLHNYIKNQISSK